MNPVPLAGYCAPRTNDPQSGCGWIGTNCVIEVVACGLWFVRCGYDIMSHSTRHTCYRSLGTSSYTSGIATPRRGGRDAFQAAADAEDFAGDPGGLAAAKEGN